jgi:hypothetical protein
MTLSQRPVVIDLDDLPRLEPEDVPLNERAVLMPTEKRRRNAGG